jgi:hypothetical protein
LNQASQGRGEVATVLMKRLTDQVAVDFNEFANEMEQDLPIFADRLSAFLESYGTAFVLLRDFQSPDQQIDEARQQIDSFARVLQESRGGLANMAQAVASMPRITTAFGAAKTRTLKVLTAVAEEWDKAIRASLSILAGLKGASS